MLGWQALYTLSYLASPMGLFLLCSVAFNYCQIFNHPHYKQRNQQTRRKGLLEIKLLRPSQELHDRSSLFSVALINTMTKSNLEVNGAYYILQVRAHNGDKLKQELGDGT